jgi:hypothetical protein
MIVKDLIAKLQQVNPDARVFMGYDGDVVVTEAREVEEIASEAALGECWWRVHVGDVVILSEKS